MTTARVKIRTAQQQDQAVLAEMVEQIGRGDPFGYTPGWIGSADGLAYVRYHIEKGWVAVADLDGRLVGHCGWSVKKAQPHQAYVRFVELETLYVSPAVRSKGIAEALVGAFGQFCRQNALSVQLVNVIPEARTLALFERLGYVEMRRMMVKGSTDS